MPLDDIKKIAEILQALVTTIGIVVGGIWSYYVFIFGRTFSHNILISFVVKNVKITENNNKLAIVTITIKNTGRIKTKKENCWIATKPILLDDMKDKPIISRLDYSLEESLSQSKLYSIFDDHEWLEPGEEATEDILIRVDESDLFKISVIFIANRKKWSSSAILEAKV